MEGDVDSHCFGHRSAQRNTFTSWPIRTEWSGGKGGLKDTGAQMSLFSLKNRGNICI